jgi:UDPglucose 6-dehydrogenase
VVDINSEQPTYFVKKIANVIGDLSGKRVAVLGLAFKPNTDDLRDGKSIEIIAQLSSLGAEIRAYDPIAIDNARKAYPHATYCTDPYQAADGADAVIIVTEWNEFKFLDFTRLKEIMRMPLVFDGRNMFDPERIRNKGIEYYCVGRASLPGD